MEVINTETGIAISLVVTFLGGVVWLTKIWVTATDNKLQVQNLHARINELERDISGFSDRMARIETKLDYIIESIKK